MQVELRNFKHYPRLSEETNAFNADVYVDGAHVATASNRGHGGDSLVHFKSREMEARMVAHVATLPDVDNPWGGDPLKMNLDFFLGLMVDELIDRSWIAKQTKTKIIFRIEGDKDAEWRTVKVTAANRAATREKIQQDYGHKVVAMHG